MIRHGFIKTRDGKWVNLDEIISITIEPSILQKENHMIVIWYKDRSKIIDFNPEMVELIEIFPTQEEAQNYLNELMMNL